MGNMIDLSKILVLFLYLRCFTCLSMRKDQSVVDSKVIAAINDDCDPSTIPVMDSFDMKRFSGKWFELAKTATGYIDVADGVWLIEGSNTSHNFLFSGRDNNHHCIRPIKGKISSAQEPPGLLTLRYKTYSTHVEEQVRVVFTDYVSVAVIYSCMYHVHTDKEVCHSAGLLGAIWTRKPHVDAEIYEKAATYLELACVHKSSLIVRNLVGPCRVDNWDFRIDDFPAPDYCYQPLDLGTCNSNVQRFYYDSKEKKCKQFTFNGCSGNQNNFMSFSECQKKCTVASNKDPVCMSVAKCALHCSPCCTEDRNGCVKCDCEHIIEDTFLNCVKSPSLCPIECEVENLYQGCHVCRCGGISKLDNDMSVCNEVKSAGNCKENLERYYYDAIYEKCERFIYTGCGGNNNNFQTLQECRETCNKAPDNEIQGSPEMIDGPSNSVLQKPSMLLITILFFIISILVTK